MDRCDYSVIQPNLHRARHHSSIANHSVNCPSSSISARGESPGFLGSEVVVLSYRRAKALVLVGNGEKMRPRPREDGWNLEFGALRRAGKGPDIGTFLLAAICERGVPW